MNTSEVSSSILKKCSTCKVSKNIFEFSKDKSKSDNLRSQCRACTKLGHKKSYIKNYKRKAAYQKEYKQNNKDKIRIWYQNSYKRHKNSLNKKRLKWAKKQYANDPKYRARVKIRRDLFELLKGNQSDYEQHLGCTKVHFLAYIESKFTTDMSWGNHGEVWHLDHIRPLSSLDLTKESDILIACHYTNHQPLLITENKKKAAKWLEKFDQEVTKT